MLPWRRDRLHARCRLLAESLTLPDPFDPGALCSQVAQERGRPIHLLPIRAMTSPCGLWVATASADYIAYDTLTSPLHRDHIVLHELAHLLCDHPTTDEAGTGWINELLTGVDLATIERFARRATYDCQQEREAELLASLIRWRADRIERRRAPDRVIDSFADRRVEPALRLALGSSRNHDRVRVAEGPYPEVTIWRGGPGWTSPR